MFDNRLPGIAALSDADDSLLVAAIAGWERVEAAAAARRLAAVAELVHRRTERPTGRERWACDDWDAAAAEVAAALNLSHGKASGQMQLGATLRNRLPRVAEAFADGMISYQVVAAIAWHTQLITDAEALALVDKSLARDALRYGPLSAAKTAQAIAAIVDQYDPGALRHTRTGARSRDVVIETTDTRNGITPLWGYLYAHDAEVLERRLMRMARDVCDDDPRTIAQRRADALGVLAAGGDRLRCGCSRPDCPAAAGSPAGAVVIHVVAHAESLDTPADPHNSGHRPGTADTTPARARAPELEPGPPAVAPPPALLLGGAVLPASLLAEMIRGGAEIRPLRLPGPDSPPEPGYRPSPGLEWFVRCRDLTCRFPGCDRPAECCDIDHAVPYPLGPTHPSNLRCVCRKHHLLKTFWVGPGGWQDRQEPDGTITWTSPTGHTYTTRPGSRLLFPALCTPTGELATARELATTPTPDRSPGDRGLMMPLRKRSRAQDLAGRINTERALNTAHIAERNKPPPF